MTRLVDAATLAETLGVSRDFVYAHADELGAIRLGTGPKPRLRFDPHCVRTDANPVRALPAVAAPLAHLSQMRQVDGHEPQAAARRPRRTTTTPLLEIRGRAA